MILLNDPNISREMLADSIVETCLQALRHEFDLDTDEQAIKMLKDSIERIESES